MIDLFAKSFCFEEALRVFRDVFCENVVCWNSIISAAVRSNENYAALDLFNEMISWDLRPNNYTYPSVLTVCRALGEIIVGRGVHGRVIKCGFEEDVFVGTAIVDLYTKCGDLEDAVEGFSRMVVRNVVSWTAIISGFVQRGDSVSAIHLFKEMRETGVEVNSYTLTSALTACANPQMTKEAFQIHSLCVKCAFDLYSAVIDSLINMYAKIGEIGMSELVFRESGTSQNVDTWAVMISGFVQNRSSGRAFHLFRRMVKEGIRPNTSCISSLVSSLDCICMGRQIHSRILKGGLVSDITVGSALLTMYSKCGSLEEAYDIFEQIHEKDKVSWTSMLAGFAEHGFAEQAFHIYHCMVLEEIQPDETTLSSILTACSVLPSLRKGKEVHAYALHAGWSKNTLVGGGLVTMYSKSGALVYASRVFELMHQNDKISCSSLVSGYAQNGCVEDSLLLYKKMLFGNMDVDSFAISSLLGMAANLTIPDLGKQLHAHVVKLGIVSDLALSNTLMIMYSKCGSIEDSHRIFIQIENPDVLTWTSIIMAFAQHGKGMEALKLYDLMRVKGVEPDSVTFTGVLSACSHSGLVEEGYSHLKSMNKYGIKPNSHHYSCMIDLLGRSGRLEEAEKLIASMPIKPDALIWGTLLAACKVHGNIELGRLAAKRIFELEPTDAGAYVSMSNISADMGQWDEVITIRSLMKGVGVTKEPGWSSM
ncbi:hypothetical protein ACHQM5_006246 [Ranunculus cassubicifolius]